MGICRKLLSKQSVRYAKVLHAAQCKCSFSTEININIKIENEMQRKTLYCNGWPLRKSRISFL